MAREYPEHPLLGVGAVVVHEGRVVIVRRASPPLLGEWSIPGGLLELGETLKDGVEREVREETGLLVDASSVLDVFDSIFRDADGRCQYHYVLVDYLCRVRGGDLRPASDVSDARWISEDGLDAYGLREATKGVLRKGLSVFRQS